MAEIEILMDKEDKSKTKVTWGDIWEDFKQRHPTLRTYVYRWEPYGFATIKLYLTDGSIMTYNYDLKHAEFIEEK